MQIVGIALHMKEIDKLAFMNQVLLYPLSHSLDCINIILPVYNENVLSSYHTSRNRAKYSGGKDSAEVIS